MSKAAVAEREANKQESIKRLRSILKPGDTVATILRSVSSSGMNRRISLIFDMEDITWHAARAMDESTKNRAGYVQDVGISVNGCGMDMGYHLVYELSRALWPNGFVCIGRSEDGAQERFRCPSNDHSNGDRNYEPHQHRDGGYALGHRWL